MTLLIAAAGGEAEAHAGVFLADFGGFASGIAVVVLFDFEFGGGVGVGPEAALAGGKRRLRL